MTKFILKEHKLFVLFFVVCFLVYGVRVLYINKDAYNLREFNHYNYGENIKKFGGEIFVYKPFTVGELDKGLISEMKDSAPDKEDINNDCICIKIKTTNIDNSLLNIGEIHDYYITSDSVVDLDLGNNEKIYVFDKNMKDVNRLKSKFYIEGLKIDDRAHILLDKDIY